MDNATASWQQAQGDQWGHHEQQQRPCAHLAAVGVLLPPFVLLAQRLLLRLLLLLVALRLPLLLHPPVQGLGLRQAASVHCHPRKR